jgi:SulP family sulfate permease
MMTGDMKNGLPPFKMLDFSLFMHPSLWSSAFSVSIIGLVEALSISKSLSLKSGTKIDVNQEFIGQGITNMGVSFFSGVVTSGSFSNTAANYQNGAKTRLSATFIGIILGITMMFLAHFAAYIPIPALAGIMMVIAYRLIDQYEIKKIIRAGGVDLLAFAVTFLSTIVISLDMAVFIGVGLTVVLYLWKSDKSSLKLLVPCADCPGQYEECLTNWVESHEADILVVQFEGDLYFGAAADMESKLDNLYGHAKGFLLRMKHVNNIDVTSIEVLHHFVHAAHRDGAEIMVSGITESVYNILKRNGLVDLIGEDNFVFAKDYLMESTNYALDTLREKIAADADVKTISID